jgi:tetratricopeptide (TPR) repeat protein
MKRREVRMRRHPVSVGDRADAARFRHELLGHLGLQADASEQDIEAAHYVLVEFLELAPHRADSWAAARTADLDEAFALLSGPEQGLISASQLASRVRRRQDETPPRPPPAPAATAATTPVTGAAKPYPRRTHVLGAVGAGLVVGVVFGVLQMGKASDVPSISGAPTGQQTSAPSGGPSTVPVDQMKVAVLMKRISANPKDVASLLALGDVYFAAAEYRNASVFEQRVLDVDPRNQAALLAMGTAQFNLGDAVKAKKQWLVAAGLYPESAEVHYDLGFLYFSQTPPDTAKMTAEWEKVVAIDPDSAIAKMVARHLKSSTPSASTTPGAK